MAVPDIHVKKTLAALAFAAAVVTLVAGCGGSSGGESSPSAAPPATPQTGNPAAPVTINESGSSLLFPYMQALAAPFNAAYPNAKLAPSAGGSGKGITDAQNGISQIGGSDAYLTAAELKSGLLNIPVAVSAQDVFYNLPGVTTPLKLNGQVLSGMYQGKIRTWNDPAVAALNPGVALPATPVVTVHRSDSSGDTFLFSGFLAKTDPQGWGAQGGPGQGTTVTWPAAPGALTANGNPGMVQSCQAAPGCVAYVGISAEDTAKAAGLGEAQLQNQAGQFVTANPQTINSAVSGSANAVPANLVANLLYAPGAQSYPIVNFEYAIVKPQQSSPDMATAVRTNLAWTVSPTGGATPALLAKAHFQAVPPNVLPKVNTAIAGIK